ncbi:MAG: 4Fe-4S dicluster domain-containing protein [Candidatus Coatesbacteria bacterium]|nr:MAG: 4Fe-4S dicluster domain-containing protein [Candidatus Coatesbacteria bacterium]
MAVEEKKSNKGYYHSVRLAADRCIGCIHCVRVCPTEALRVHYGKARINPLRCVDCGECIRVCPTNAKYAQTDPWEALERFKYKVAIPSSALVGQFKSSVPPDKVYSALLGLGFDEVYEGALGGEIISLAVRDYLNKNGPRVKPTISSLCPAVVRLIQVRFPSLVSHIIPIEAPMDAAARVVKISRSRHLGLAPEEIGAFFITPCPAKVTAIKQPVATRDYFVDGAFGISDVYNRIMNNVDKIKVVPGIARASGLGIGWGAAGGENRLLGQGRRLAVDGIDNVVRVLELIEGDEYHHGYEYLEMRACTGGCVGGPLATQEPFVAKHHIDQLRRERGETFGIEEGRPPDLPYAEIVEMVESRVFHLKAPVEPRPTMGLGTDLAETITRMKELEGLIVSLPGIDCGSCGAPTCRAFAEDVVLGKAHLTDCTFKLRDRILKLAEEMSSLSGQLPPTLKTRESGETHGTEEDS